MSGHPTCPQFSVITAAVLLSPVFEFLMVIDTLIGLLKDSRVSALVFAGAIGGFLFRELRIVWPPGIVMVKPGDQRRAALLRTGIGAGVGPLVQAG
jgi:hypothetical protein